MPLAQSAIFKLFERIQHGCLDVACPGGTRTFGNPQSELRAVIVVHDDAFFRRAFYDGEIGMGESYMAGEWSSPDLLPVMRLGVRNIEALNGQAFLMSGARKLLGLFQHWTRRNTIAGSRRNIGYHYDLGNDFYGLFLDSAMAYSCAYFETAGDTLEQAQINKFDRICRKLRIQPGSNLLEIGTGWGGFAIHAASRYGCRVTTTTISRKQYEYACDWVKRSGLSGAIEVLADDYRVLRGTYDHIVSIEMFEAVGYGHYDDYFRICDRLLKPAGTMLLQTITMNEQRFPGYIRDYDWIKKYIFPGGELASLAGILRSLASVTNMSLYHAEDIGAHYARTLNAWRKRFHKAVPLLPGLGFDEMFLRMWSYYLTFCEAAFLERHIGDFQLLLTKNRNLEPLMDEPWRRSSRLTEGGREPLAA